MVFLLTNVKIMGAHKLVNCRSKSHGNYPDRSETEIKLIIEFKGNLYPILRKKVISILIYLFFVLIFCHKKGFSPFLLRF